MITQIIDGWRMIDAQSLWRRYLLAFVLVAVVSTAAFGASYLASGITEHHVAAVGISGRQRMLSQRIALLATQHASSPDTATRERAAKALAEAVDQFQASHRDLINGNPSRNLTLDLPVDLNVLYFEPPVRLDRQIDQYVTLARRLLADDNVEKAAIANDIADRAGQVLDGLEQAAAVYSKDGRDAAAGARFVEFAAWLSGLAFLALIAAAVVRPAYRRIVEDLDASARKIAAANAASEQFEADNRRLREAVNSMRDGFAVYDAQDRLMMANRAFRDFHRPIEDLIVPGATFEQLVRAGLERNMWMLNGQDPEEWLQEQLKTRRENDEIETEVMLADGRCMLRRERRVENGEIIGTRIDVTRDRAREDELRSTEQQLERLAFFDELTGLPNRFHCQKDLAEKFVFAEVDEKFAVIHLDLDNFKRVNDTLGHAAGDRLLTDIGSRLTLMCNEMTFLKAYRWGGDEFIVTVSRDEDVDLEIICQELTDDLAVPLTFNGSILRPTVSIGIARYPEDGVDVDSLMKFADLALYATKERGRDGYQFFTSEMKEKADIESWMETELRAAIDTGLLSLVYQPQVRMTDGSISGVEALIRWDHPQKGLISPSEFLPIAEATNLARPIGRFVFDEAMKAARSWLDQELEFGRVAINLSPQHLKSGLINDDFLESMERHRITPRHLTAEILESLLLDDPHSNKAETIRQLHDLGVNIELDDFGTGYASLAHLSSLPIHGIKVDRSFVNQILIDSKKYSVVKTLINLAKMLRIGVVCEGIETGEQMAALRKFGDFSLQGYHIARPMSFTDMTAWLETNRATGAQARRATA